jgi:hypothetical protein
MGGIVPLWITGGFNDTIEWFEAGHPNHRLDTLISSRTTSFDLQTTVELMDVTTQEIRVPFMLTDSVNCVFRDTIRIMMGDTTSIPPIIISTDTTLLCGGASPVLTLESADFSNASGMTFDLFIKNNIGGDRRFVSSHTVFPITVPTPGNGDSVFVVAKLGNACLANSEVISNTLVFDTIPSIAVTISIQQRYANDTASNIYIYICPDQSITFMAETNPPNDVNGIIRWYRNGIHNPQDTGYDVTFAEGLNRGDTVYARFYSSVECARYATDTTSNIKIVRYKDHEMPTITHLQIIPQTVCSGDSVDVIAHLSHYDDGTIQYHWRVNGFANPEHWSGSSIHNGQGIRLRNLTTAQGTMGYYVPWVILSSDLGCARDTMRTEDTIFVIGGEFFTAQLQSSPQDTICAMFAEERIRFTPNPGNFVIDGRREQAVIEGDSLLRVWDGVSATGVAAR